MKLKDVVKELQKAENIVILNKEGNAVELKALDAQGKEYGDYRVQSIYVHFDSDTAPTTFISLW